jgi:hypothetical protein
MALFIGDGVVVVKHKLPGLRGNDISDLVGYSTTL